MDKYIILDKIGEGAQGLVLKGYHRSTEQEVALKRILLKKVEEGISISVIREVKTLQQLKHPYVWQYSNLFILLYINVYYKKSLYIHCYVIIGHRTIRYFSIRFRLYNGFWVYAHRIMGNIKR